nr:hypothetical protein [Aestuariivivens sediminicola]
MGKKFPENFRNERYSFAQAIGPNFKKLTIPFMYTAPKISSNKN